MQNCFSTFSSVKINLQSTIKTAISKTAKLSLRGIFRTVKNLKWMSFLQIIVYGLKLLTVFVKELPYTAQNIKFSIKDFFSKCDQIRRTLRIWSHLLMNSLMENFIFWAVVDVWLGFVYESYPILKFMHK